MAASEQAWLGGPMIPGDPLQDRVGRLVGGGLGHGLGLERPHEDGLPEPVGPLQVGRYSGFEFVDQRKAALDLCDDATLFRNRTDWDRHRFDVAKVNMGMC